MKRTTVATAIAIALLASAILTAGTPPGAAANDHEAPQTGGRVEIQPAPVLDALEAGQPFQLPGPDGTLTLHPGPRIQETIRYTDTDEDGQRVTTERAPNVWWVGTQNGSTDGMVLAFDHTVRAWVRHDGGTTLVEPVSATSAEPDGAPAYTLHRLEEELGGLGPTSDGGDGSVGPLTHIQVYKDVYAYVDPEYRNQYGSCCWADQVAYILGLLNGYFDDVELEYRYGGGEVDAGFTGTSMDDSWNRIVYKPYNGADVKSHWSYRDFDGCEVGRATYPGSIMLIQHAPDTCHLGLVPGTDAERAYLTAHELGKNNYAHPYYHWSDTTLTGHEHRSIMDDSLWGHYHGCWSSTNMNRMSSYLGTSSVGTPCS